MSNGGHKLDPIFDAWIEAAKVVGCREIDDNWSSDTEGAARSQYSTHDGCRSSTAATYLKPALIGIS